MTTPSQTSTCPQCGGSFTCGIANGQSSCWCFDLPHIIPLDRIGDDAPQCLCPACLQEKINQQSTNPDS